MSYIKVQQFTKNYGDTRIFHDIEFTLQQGEFITLLGPSGCGKSTLLRCIAGLEQPDSGRLIVENNDITTEPPQKRNIGMVFQSYALFPNMTVERNIAFGLKMAKCSPIEIQRRVAEAVALVELEGKEQHYPAQLSGGQRQRVALARALVVRPRILLLDEPLSALDARIRKNLREQIRTIQRQLNLTTLFVTHDQEEALQLSDRIFVMEQGKIIQSGSAEEVYTQPANLAVARFIGHYNFLNVEQARQLLGPEHQKQIAIRPESIQLLAASDTTPGTALMGQVIQRQLLGSVMRYEISVQGIRLIVDQLNRNPQALWPLDASVQVCINLNDCAGLQ